MEQLKRVKCVKSVVIRNGLFSNTDSGVDINLYTGCVGILTPTEVEGVYNISGKGVGVIEGMEVMISHSLADSPLYFIPVHNKIRTSKSSKLASE